MQRPERMTALIQSCAKWREPFKRNLTNRDCPLCMLYNVIDGGVCCGGPVAEDTGHVYCRGTPFRAYVVSLNLGKLEDSLRLKEYQYLRGLWKKERSKCKTQSN